VRVSEGAVLRQLTWIQAKRYATHPLFLGPLALLVATAFAMSDDAPNSYYTLGDHVSSAFFLGVFGIVVGYRLTRTEDRAIALLPSAPTAASTRTLALLGACLVPAVAGLFMVVTRLVTWMVWPPPEDLVPTAGGWLSVLAMQLDGFVVASFGAPALGVAAGRWLRFPGAGVLVALAVTLTTVVFVSGAQQVPGAGDNAVVRAVAAAMPWADWMIINQPVGQPAELLGVRSGSPVGHLLYAISLSGLACWAAVMKDAVGVTRRRWTRVGVALGVAAAVTYLWALLG
jgi:hypothetical protein